MKLLDKFKDLFMDEISEDDEIELEEENRGEYNEPQGVLPKVMRDTITKEEENKRNGSDGNIKDKLNNQKQFKEFKFPVDFNDEISEMENRKKIEDEKKDIIIDKSSFGYGNNNQENINFFEREATKKVSELYSKKEVIEKTKFKASPVISPVYGVLDKNYRKDEVKEKSEDNIDMKRPSKKVDFETVRRKAFGNLVDEIKENLMCENCELYKEVKKISALKEDDLLYNMTVDDNLEDENDVTIGKAYNNYEEFGVAYEYSKKDEEIIDEDKNKLANEDKNYSLNDDIINKFIKNEDTNIDSSLENEDNIPSRVKKQEKDKEPKVDDDFFALIDSMYKERIDE